MASTGGLQLTALCAVASFLWFAHSIERHQLIEQPRLSSLLLLLIASAASFAASFFSQWLPGANGRFDDDLGLRRTGRQALPPKETRRYFLPGLVVCVIIRLEIFHRVSLDLQCSTPGVEAFLPAIVYIYEKVLGRWTQTHEEKHDDIGDTVYDFAAKTLATWIGESAALLLSCGVYLIASQNLQSTYFCSCLDRSSLIVLLEWVGLLLDGAIAILSWRIISWSRTTKTRLKTLSSILMASAVGTGLLYWSSRLFQVSKPMSYHFRGLDSLYLFDVVVDGITFSICLVSSSLLVSEGKPLSLVGILTFLTGMILGLQKIKMIGSWENISPFPTTFAVAVICISFSIFIYVNNLRTVVIIHRVLLVLILAVLVIATTIVSIIKGNRVFNDHPLQRLVYDSRVAADRWQLRATTSNSLPIAVQEYKDRHNGRDPPAKFDAWYEFATNRSSPIIDYFNQIENDISPFLGLSPDKIRKDIQRMALEPDIALVKIQSGGASHNVPRSSPHWTVIDDLVGMINAFAKHLPDMEFAVNLDESPRVLAPWEDVERAIEAGESSRLSKLLSKRDGALDDNIETWPQTLLDENTAKNALQATPFTSVRALREMTALSCPPGTSTRSGVHWNIRDFCSSCVKPQSPGQYITNWPVAQGICHQADLLRLHSFHMTSPTFRPLQELVPVFSRSKTTSYNDILIPLERTGDQGKNDNGEPFSSKRKGLYWRGSADRDVITTSHHDLLHGGHRERLVHFVNKKTPGRGETTLMLPTSKYKAKFAYQQLPTSVLRSALPIDVAFTNYTAINQADMTISPSNSVTGAQTTLHELAHQYVLTVDTDLGPPPNFLSVVRSRSVPFHASIFQEWYAERLTPWVHFVPVDLRWHALHSTLAYFTGIYHPKEERDDNKVGGGEVNTKGNRSKGKRRPSPPATPNAAVPAAAAVKGRRQSWQEMPGRDLDGQWIADEGMKWARKALRREDREVYLFRLLIEWARVVSNDREGMKFVL